MDAKHTSLDITFSNRFINIGGAITPYGTYCLEITMVADNNIGGVCSGIVNTHCIIKLQK